MNREYFLVILLSFVALFMTAQEPFDTSIADWDYKALTEMEWIMEIMGTYQNSIPRIYIRETGGGMDEFFAELPKGKIGGYSILKPENGNEYYAILEDEIERDVFFRRVDGFVSLGNNEKSIGVFAIREKENEPGIYYRDVLEWPLEIAHYPEDSWFFYKNGMPERYKYPGKGSFYSAFDTPENTMEGVYIHPATGEEDFRMLKLPNYNWRLSMSLPSTQMQAYGHIFCCFIRQLEPGVWESDGAYGIKYTLYFEPEKRRIRLVWEENSWKDFPLMNVYLYPYEDVFTPDGQVIIH